MSENNNYINVVYDEKIRPKTDYPSKLIKYLINRFNLTKNDILLDTGTGRKEFYNAFINNGLNCYGIDLDDYDNKKIFKVNLESEKLPFPDEYFSVIFSKSFLEHLHRPENYMSEIYRVLKKDGKLIILVPNWITCFYLYYTDYTHKQPYTKESLFDLLKINKFKDIFVEEFIQLPQVWKYPILNIAVKFLQLFGSPKKFIKNKFIRFSRETMVLGFCKK